MEWQQTANMALEEKRFTEILWSIKP